LRSPRSLPFFREGSWRSFFPHRSPSFPFLLGSLGRVAFFFDKLLFPPLPRRGDQSWAGASSPRFPNPFTVAGRWSPSSILFLVGAEAISSRLFSGGFLRDRAIFSCGAAKVLFVRHGDPFPPSANGLFSLRCFRERWRTIPRPSSPRNTNGPSFCSWLVFFPFPAAKRLRTLFFAALEESPLSKQKMFFPSERRPRKRARVPPPPPPPFSDRRLAAVALPFPRSVVLSQRRLARSFHRW